MNDCCKKTLEEVAEKISKISEKDLDFPEDADLSNGPPPMTEAQFGMMKAYMNVFQVLEEAGLEPEAKIKRYSSNG
jgi:hypothetical protein